MLKLNKTVNYKGFEFDVEIKENGYSAYLKITDEYNNSYEQAITTDIHKSHYKELIENEVKSFYNKLYQDLAELSDWDGVIDCSNNEDDEDADKFTNFLCEMRDDIDRLNIELNMMKDGNDASKRIINNLKEWSKS